MSIISNAQTQHRYTESILYVIQWSLLEGASSIDPLRAGQCKCTKFNTNENMFLRQSAHGETSYQHLSFFLQGCINKSPPRAPSLTSFTKMPSRLVIQFPSLYAVRAARGGVATKTETEQLFPTFPAKFPSADRKTGSRELREERFGTPIGAVPPKRPATRAWRCS